MKQHRADHPTPLPRRRPRLGGAVHIALALAALGGVVWAGIASTATTSTSSALKKSAKSKRLLPPGRREVEVALERIGLTSTSVAAAGLTGAQVLSVVGNAADSVRANIQVLRDADESAGQARADADRLERLIQSGLSSAEDGAAYAAAQASLAAAQAQAQSVLMTAYLAGVTTLGAEQRAVLEALDANKSWDLPVQYRAANRAQADWVALRDALANDRVSTQLGIAPDPVAQQLLTSANASATVAAASSNITSNLGSLQPAWNQAVGP